MPFCPQCGSEVGPDDQSCASCGASLIPDQPATGTKPALFPPAGLRATPVLIAGAVIVLLILAVVFAGYPMLNESSASAAPDSLAAPMAGSGNTSGGSWVEVITEEQTPLSTTEVPATTVPTTIFTTATPYQTTKPVICAADRVKCNNTCVDMRTDTMNCGLCGVECESGHFCLNGVCMDTCSAGQTSCPDGCFDLMSDKDHCGSCLNDCPKGLICYRGQCIAPATPMPVPL